MRLHKIITGVVFIASVILLIVGYELAPRDILPSLAASTIGLLGLCIVSELIGMNNIFKKQKDEKNRI